MACLVFMLLLLSMAGHSFAEVATWCVCKDGHPGLQAALDYACGNGADCNKIKNGGACANPNILKYQCSYAVNSYFQNKAKANSACNFSGAATIVTSDPSPNAGCPYPSTASSTPTTTITPPTPGMGYGVGTPYTTLTPPTPGMGYGIGPPYPTGVGLYPPGLDTDISDGGVRSPTSILMWSSMILTFSALVFW